MAHVFKGGCAKCSYFMWVEEAKAKCCVNPQMTQKVVGQDGGLYRKLTAPRNPATQDCSLWTMDDLLPGEPEDPKGKAVVIVGTGPTMFRYKWCIGLHEDPEVWSLNSGLVPEADRHFNIHFPHYAVDQTEALKREEEGSLEFVRQENYPFDKVWMPDKLHSTIDYMLALADAEDFEYIYLPGVDFWGQREEEWESRGCEIRITRLITRGAYVWWSYMSELMMPWMYGAVGEKLSEKK